MKKGRKTRIWSKYLNELLRRQGPRDWFQRQFVPAHQTCVFETVVEFVGFRQIVKDEDAVLSLTDIDLPEINLLQGKADLNR